MVEMLISLFHARNAFIKLLKDKQDKTIDSFYTYVIC